MKIAFLADPLADFKIYKDSTYAMMVEAAKRGHTIYAFESQHMAYENGVVVADVAQVILTSEAEGAEHASWYRIGAASSQSLTAFDAIVVRKDPPFNMEYVYTTYLLEIAQAQGARIFNKPEAVRSHNEKLAIAQFPQFTAPTLVSSDEARLRAFHQTHQDIILKPLDGMGGAGIVRIRSDGMNLGSVIEMLTLNGSRTIMAQRFIPEIAQGDKRVLLIAGQVVPFSLARIPQAGEVRGNLAAGGTGVAQELTARERVVAEALAPILFARGLFLVGLDMIGGYLTEVNVTSPTCFQEIFQQTGCNVAEMFMQSLEKVHTS